MAVRKFKPTTPGQRHKVIGVFKGVITATAPEKSLTVGKKSTGGRNAEGHLTNRYMGVATNANTASSTSRETKTVFPQ